MNNPQPYFRTRARILCQLGEQLIKNESIALLELIKNSYDADATICDVVMTNPSDPTNASIIIRDNGDGMSYDTIINVWLEIGTDYKEKQLSNSETRKTAKFHRMRLGEKGIGRLGVHRLGREIELITKTQDSPEEVVLKINWDVAEKAKLIEDIPVSIEKRKASIFKNNESGTIIKITKLRNAWTRGGLRECKRSISALNSPFKTLDSFKASLYIEGKEKSWVEDLMDFAAVQDYALFHFDITMAGKNIQSFKYEFKPWSVLDKLKERIVIWDKSNVNSRIITLQRDERGKKQESEVDLANPNIGEVRFQGIIFDRDSRILTLGVQDKAGLKEYLDINGGIKVFRDNMRIMDYGEPKNDWLDLNSRRVNRPGVHISNNVIIGAVYLDRESSVNLTEKANREGFLENEAYQNLYNALEFCLERIEAERTLDKNLLRKHYGPQESSAPVTTSIAELKDIIDSSVKEENIRSKMIICLNRIESDYESITESLLKSAGAGLNLIVVIHQMEKILKDVQSMIKQKAKANLIEERVADLTNLVEGYSILVRNSSIKERNLKGIVKQAIFNISFRLRAHNVETINAFENATQTDALCAENHVLNALLNIFDNSIWWLGYSQTQPAKIFIDISAAFKNYISIVIADNGPGFTKPTDDIVKPFISDKPGGMGIGLHLTDEIMKALNGKLLFPSTDIFEIPEEFRKGAIVALAFPIQGE